MYKFELKNILNSDELEVLAKNQYWPAALDNALAIMDRDLGNDEELRRLARPILFLICHDFGPAHYYMPQGARMRDFIFEKRLYDLSINAPDAMKSLAQKKRIKESILLSILERQSDIEERSTSIERDENRGELWKCTVVRIVNSISCMVRHLELSEPKRAKLIEALLSGICDSRTRSIIQLPQCRSLASALRDKQLIRSVAVYGVFETARDFHVSPQHVYRILKSDAERRKEEASLAERSA